MRYEVLVLSRAKPRNWMIKIPIGEFVDLEEAKKFVEGDPDTDYLIEPRMASEDK